MFRDRFFSRDVRRRGPRLIAIVSLLVPLAACQTGGPQALSLEEAKRVSATFQGGVEPPPRSINDITAILEQESDVEDAELSKMMAAANAKPPANATDEEMVGFLLERGGIADALGMRSQAFRDMREAERYARAAGFVPPRLLINLMWLEFQNGNTKKAREYMKEWVPQSVNYARGYYGLDKNVDRYIESGTFDAYTGDLRAAKESLRMVRKITIGWRPPVHATIAVEMVAAPIALVEGRFEDAVTRFRRLVRARVATGEAKRRPGGNLRWRWMIGMALRMQGRLVESELEIRETLLEALRIGGKSGMAADLAGELATTLFAQGRYADAETLAQATVDLFDELGIPRTGLTPTLVRYLLGNIKLARKDWDGAVGEFEQFKKGPGWLVDKSTMFDSGAELALLMAGKTKEGLASISKNHETTKALFGEKHYATNEKLGVLAMAHAANGQLERALSEFEKALPVLLSRSQHSTSQTVPQRAVEERIKVILTAYIGALAQSQASGLRTNPAAEAFRIAGIVRAASVQRALAASAARAAAGNPELADLARQEQDIRRRIGAQHALLGNMLSEPGRQKDDDAVQALRTQIDRLRGAGTALTKEILSRFPEYSDLVDPKPATIEMSRRVLGPGEALISTLVGEHDTYVWAVPYQGDVAFAVADIGRRELTGKVSLLRTALEPNATTMGDIPAFDVKAAYDLYAKLLKPVEAGWKTANSLLVVADGALAQLPLSLLPTEPVTLKPNKGGKALFSNYRDIPWLARTHAVTVLPSVASLKALRGTMVAGGERRPFAGFGDPYFSKSQELAANEAEPVQVASAEVRGMPVKLRNKPQTRGVDSATLARLPRLADTRTEISAIAEALGADPSRDVFLGARASEGRVKAMDLTLYKVISFATHGLVPGDLNGLTQPALALSSPQVTGDKEDGLLTMGEILGLRLNADWVVLSACNTASADGKGAEAVSGLGRAFFYAGTRALLVSNWPVHSAATTELTTELFRRQAANDNLSRAEALRQTRIHLIDEAEFTDAQGRTAFSYAHPIFWAPFTVVGDGGGGSAPAS